MLQVTHRGGALQVGDRLLRLKDLLPLEELEGAGLRLRSARLERGQIELELEDGRRRQVAVPAAASEGPPDLLIRGAGQILTMAGAGIGLLAGGSISCRQGRILAISEDPAPATELAPGARILEARGGVVTPGLVDPHTHPVFAGERSLEFAMKAEGRSYLDIHHAGGGILSTVRATRAASFAELARSCAANLDRLLGWGVTTCEGKSGYALEAEGELRLLEVLRTVADCHPVDVEPTLLGAHALPPEHAADRGAYLREVTEIMIPRAAAGQLARFCDAYCEEGAFTPEEVSTIFRAARAAGLDLRLHAEQFTDQGGAALAASFAAASADHLEVVSPAGIEALAAAGTRAVLLPGAALACRCPWPPARALIEAGVGVALGTDLNPGSSYTAALPLMMSLACMQMRMSCEEVWRAVTVEAADSLRRPDLGRLEPGCQADLVIFEAPDYRYVPYHYGENHARQVIKRGRLVIDRS